MSKVFGPRALSGRRMKFVSASAAPLPLWLRRVRSVAVAVLALIVLFALLGFFAVPPIAKAQIESRGNEGLGRQVTLRKIEFNPFTLKATLFDLAIADRERERPLLALDALEIDLSSASLWHRAPV